MEGSNDLLRLFSDMIDPVGYVERLWGELYEWQKEAIEPGDKRVMLNCARQSGKSSVVSALALNQAKYNMNSLVLILAPSEKQSKETMLKVDDYIGMDEDLKAIALPGDSQFEKRFRNKSRIVALPGTEKSIRGYSKPALIILDEAARIEDGTYKAVRPMLTGNPDAKLYLLSTPWNKSGFYYEEWTRNPIWKKIYVVPRWELDEEDRLVERIPEADFRNYWAGKGVKGYYSPRHTLEHLYEELLSIGSIWFRREYGCEFIEGLETLFSNDLIESAYNDEIEIREEKTEQYDDGFDVITERYFK